MGSSARRAAASLADISKISTDPSLVSVCAAGALRGRPRSPRRRGAGGRRIRLGIDRLVALLVRNPLAPAVLALPVGIAFVADPKWLMWFGVRTPDSSLVTNAQAWIGFGTAFGFGWLLHRQMELIQTLERRWALNLLLATGLVVASLAIAGLTPRLTPIQDDTTRLVGAACYALAIWTATFAVIGIALRFLSGFDAPQHTAVSCQLPAWLMFCKVARAAMLSCDPLSHSLNPKVT